MICKHPLIKKCLVPLLFMLPAVTFADNSEIAAAREGAPKHVSENARILVWQGGRYVEKVKGSNDFTCLVWADKQGTFEPSCLNTAATKAILPLYEFQRSMLEKNQSIDAIHSNIAKKAQLGEFSAPEPGAVVYMMSQRNKFYLHGKGELVSVEPHIMLYYPKLEQRTLGFNGKEGLPGFYSDFPHVSVVHIPTNGKHNM